ncbi:MULTISPECIES: septum formation initiator family protein [Lysinibacillus]|uniref:Septum formation initiator n=1 Tax=Lysinibacillus antri TaxID=2498145 RepID=A0A3S0RU72_9BACI|nr:MULTISPECIES: septum formation initiator family protein [Lysinibacillus]RUL49136.1 septum formation initiator [Lysinibacillus antri]TSI05476.1 septum formation initiator [Lysinibacillus sp. BW-2-10]
MAKRRKQNDQQSNNVRTLENDYVRSSDKKAKYLKQQKIRFRRRMVAFTIVAVVVLAFLISANMAQNKRLAEKERQKEQILGELEAVKEQQELLNLQISKLEDDEYIAKLARKEYFLSDDGEIIFTIPKDEEDNN